MALKKINWVVFGFLAVLALAWILWSQQSQQMSGASITSDLVPASDATLLSGSPRGIVQKVEMAAFSLPVFEVQSPKFDSVSRPIPKVIETVSSSPRIQKPATIRTSKTVSVRPAARLV